MGSHFLSNFLRVAYRQTSTERAAALDVDFTIVDLINLDEEEVLADDFVGRGYIAEAMESNRPIITNNAVSDPAYAPVTKTNFSDLRLVVVVPVASYGAVYLDQPVRFGIISRETVERLLRLADYAVENNLTQSSEAELNELYTRME